MTIIKHLYIIYFLNIQNHPWQLSNICI